MLTNLAAITWQAVLSTLVSLFPACTKDNVFIYDNRTVRFGFEALRRFAVHIMP
jgi:hypothetical protein